MKKIYYIVSFILFVLLFIGIHLAKMILGGETKVSFEWSVIFTSIFVNTTIFVVMVVIDTFRDK